MASESERDALISSAVERASCAHNPAQFIAALVDAIQAIARYTDTAFAALPPGDAAYTHHQLTPSTTWDVPHGLGKIPAVTVMDSAGTVVYGARDDLDLDHLRLRFGAPFSGSAFCN